jgi:hypothetical protein
MLVMTLSSHVGDDASETVPVIAHQGATADRQGATVDRLGVIGAHPGAASDCHGAIVDHQSATDSC